MKSYNKNPTKSSQLRFDPHLLQRADARHLHGSTYDGDGTGGTPGLECVDAL